MCLSILLILAWQACKSVLMVIELPTGASSRVTRIAVVSGKLDDALLSTLPMIDRLMSGKETAHDMRALMPVLLKEPSVQVAIL